MGEATETSHGSETLTGTIAKFTMAAAGFVGSVAFAWLLGREEFGAYYALLAVVKVADRPLNGWANAAKKRFSERHANRPEVFGALILAVLCFAVLAGISAVAAGPFLRDRTGIPNAAVLFFVLAVSLTLFEPFEQLIQAQGRLGIANWMDTVRSYLTLPLQLGLVYVGYSTEGMVFGLSVATILTLPILLNIIGTRPEIPSRETLRSMWTYARYSIPGQLVGKTYNRFDILLLLALSGSYAAAGYEVAAKLTMPAVFLSIVAASGLMARVSNHDTQAALVEDVRNTLAFSSILALPILAGVLALPRPLISIYSAKYIDAWPLLVGLACYRVLETQARPLAQTLNGLDRPRTVFRISAVALAINAILGVAFFELYGPLAIVAATILAELVRYGGLAIAVRRVLPSVGLVGRTFLEQVAASTVMFGALVMIERVVTTWSWFSLGVTVFASASVYGVVLLAISPKLRVTIGAVLAESPLAKFVPPRVLAWRDVEE